MMKKRCLGRLSKRVRERSRCDLIRNRQRKMRRIRDFKQLSNHLLRRVNLLDRELSLRSENAS